MSAEVHIWTERDDDAHKIICVLEALGYDAKRVFDETQPTSKRNHEVGRLARRYQLTNRETQILALVFDGSSNEKISKALDISRPVVKWHLHNIFSKTGTTSREGLLRLALTG